MATEEKVLFRPSARRPKARAFLVLATTDPVAVQSKAQQSLSAIEPETPRQFSVSNVGEVANIGVAVVSLDALNAKVKHGSGSDAATIVVDVVTTKLWFDAHATSSDAAPSVLFNEKCKLITAADGTPWYTASAKSPLPMLIHLGRTFRDVLSAPDCVRGLKGFTHVLCAVCVSAVDPSHAELSFLGVVTDDEMIPEDVLYNSITKQIAFPLPRTAISWLGEALLYAEASSKHRSTHKLYLADLDPRKSVALPSKPTLLSVDDVLAYGAGAPKSKFAYATLVMLGDTYIPGAIALAWSLRYAGTKHDLVVMISEDVSLAGRFALNRLFDRVIVVPLIEGEAIQGGWEKRKHLYGWMSKCFTKINAANLTDYEKVAMVDADMLAVSNPDEIFDLPTPAGICSSIGFDDPLDHNRRHGKKLPKAMVQDSVSKYGMRGCLYLLKPSAADYQAMRAILAERGGYGDNEHYIGADERLITEFYIDQWTHIHLKFGCHSWAPQILGGESPVMLHFVTEKPWIATDQDWPDYLLWHKFARECAEKVPEVASFLERKHARSQGELLVVKQKRNEEQRRREKEEERERFRKIREVTKEKLSQLKQASAAGTDSTGDSKHDDKDDAPTAAASASAAATSAGAAAPATGRWQPGPRPSSDRAPPHDTRHESSGRSRWDRDDRDRNAAPAGRDRRDDRQWGRGNSTADAGSWRRDDSAADSRPNSTSRSSDKGGRGGSSTVKDAPPSSGNRRW